eukprot:scaffold2801_cov106-Skeletonema_dohrnii-CCMP3373.AAC.1
MHNDVVDSDNAARADPAMDDHGSSCCNNESLLITAMNHHRSTSSAEAPARGEPAVPFSSGASKSITCPSPPQMEKMIVLDSESNALSAAGASNESGLLLDDSDMTQPVVSSSPCLISGVMQDHPIDGAVSDDHGRDGNKTKRGKKRSLSLCNRSHFRRNNDGHKSRVLSVMVLSLCWMSFAAANVSPNATTTQAAITSSTAVASTTVSPLNTTTTGSAVIDGNISTTATTAATTTTAATIITNATTTTAATTTTTTTTTTVGGLKLITDDDDDVQLQPCRQQTNFGQCKQYEQCTWISGSCDFNHLPVTSTSPPTTMNSRAPPTSDAPSPQPTFAPVVVPTTPSPVPGGGGTKVITDSPTLQPSPPPSPPPTKLPTKVPTPLPTPKPTTKSPTPLPTVEPTTKAPTEVPTVRPTTKAPTEEPTDVPSYSPTSRPTPGPTRNPTPRPTRNP